MKLPKPGAVDDVLRQPQAAALLKNRAALEQLAQSPETQRLLQLLQQQNQAGLQAAARQAEQGDTSALAQMVRQLLESGEGSDLARRIQQSMPK